MRVTFDRTADASYIKLSDKKIDHTSAADYLNKSEVTLRRWVKDGSVPYYRLGREYLFIKEELDEFIKKA